jgi:hypothetical protein
MRAPVEFMGINGSLAKRHEVMVSVGALPLQGDTIILRQILSVHRQCFAQIAREVRVVTAQHAHMVGKQLQGQHC